MSVYEELCKYKDDKYRDFQSNLVPNISKDVILGVRTPDMRKIAKEMFNTDEGKKFLKKLPHKYYEENLVHFLKFVDDCTNLPSGPFFYDCNDKRF